MRKTLPPQYERYRQRSGPWGSNSGSISGAYVIPYVPSNPRALGSVLTVIARNGDGWDHVSVSTSYRCPTYEELKYIKGIFWDPEETVVQFFPRTDKHVNFHPFCLHLWRRHGLDYPLPPAEYIA